MTRPSPSVPVHVVMKMTFTSRLAAMNFFQPPSFNSD